MTYLTAGLMLSHSVMPNSLQPYGLWPARLLCPWGFSRQEYWSGLHFLLQEIFPTQGMNPRLICLLHWDSLPPEPLGLVLPGVNLVTPFSWVLGSGGTYGMPGPIFKAWGQPDLHAGKVISLANLSHMSVWREFYTTMDSEKGYSLGVINLVIYPDGLCNISKIYICGFTELQSDDDEDADSNHNTILNNAYHFI